jgi:hypothetical protein
MMIGTANLNASKSTHVNRWDVLLVATASGY